MNNHDRIVAALVEEAHDPTGWMSDAQSAQLEVDEYGNVSFCGEGSIDLNHMASIVLSVIEETK